MKLLLGGLLASGVLVATMATVIELKNREETGLRATIGNYEACASAVANSELTASAARCSDAVAAVHARSVRSQRCDAALLKGDLFAGEAACSTEVKTVVAERTAAAREADNLNTLLAQVRSGQAAAIARAEARGRTQAQRTASAQDRLDSAPRSDAGLGRCDADCLQRLGGG